MYRRCPPRPAAPLRPVTDGDLRVASLRPIIQSAQSPRRQRSTGTRPPRVLFLFFFYHYCCCYDNGRQPHLSNPTIVQSALFKRVIIDCNIVQRQRNRRNSPLTAAAPSHGRLVNAPSQENLLAHLAKNNGEGVTF